MSSGIRVAVDTVIFFGGDTRGARSFFSLAMDRWRTGAPQSTNVSFIPAADTLVLETGCWVPCFSSSDRRASAAHALEQGAEQAVILDTPRGSLCLYAAPDGALFALTDASFDRKPEGMGEVAFVDLYTHRAAAIAQFYADALSCRLVREVEPTPGDYRFLASDEDPVVGVVDMLGVLPAGSAAVTPHWIPLWRVPDLDAEVARLSDLGARVRVPATESSLGPFALLADPFGVTFGLQTPVSDDLLAEHARLQSRM